MFLNEKYLQITQSYDITNYFWGVLYTRLVSGVRPVSIAQTGLDTQLDSKLPLKLHVLVYLFAAYQRCRTISASYTT